MRELGLSSVLSMSPLASVQPVGEGAVILLVDSGQLYTCNATSEALLSRVDGARTLGEIADAICEEFEVDAATAAADVVEMAHSLLDQGIVRLAP